MIIKEINLIANPPVGIIKTETYSTSFRLAPAHKDYLNKLVKEGAFLSRSEAVRYCIQFCKDLEINLNLIIKSMIEELK